MTRFRKGQRYAGMAETWWDLLYKADEEKGILSACRPRTPAGGLLARGFIRREVNPDAPEGLYRCRTTVKGHELLRLRDLERERIETSPEGDRRPSAPALGTTPYPDQLPGHTRGRPTTREAAISQLPTLREKQVHALGVLFAAGEGGLTDHEASERLGRVLGRKVERDAYGPRRNELAKMDPPLCKEVPGVRRPTPRGGTAMVWRITQEGIRAYRQAVGGVEAGP